MTIEIKQHLNKIMLNLNIIKTELFPSQINLMNQLRKCLEKKRRQLKKRKHKIMLKLEKIKLD